VRVCVLESLCVGETQKCVVYSGCVVESVLCVRARVRVRVRVHECVRCVFNEFYCQILFVNFFLNIFVNFFFL
jgi:hypothetical protein